MIHAVIILLQLVVLATGVTNASAETQSPVDGLQIDGTLDAISNQEVVEAILSAAPVAPPVGSDELTIEPSAAAEVDGDWLETAGSAVGYPVTQTIFLGVAYQHEEIEDLTAEYIELGTAGVDYTSHKVLVRAQWQFDLTP